MEARCGQCGTLWQVDTDAVDPDQPYQCNACGFIFSISLEGSSPMQIRHTNGKIYKVKDLTTLVRWVGEKRVPRQCMVREDDGEWQQALAIPEVAEAFALLDARRRQGSNAPKPAEKAVQDVVEAAAQPVDPTAVVAAVSEAPSLAAEGQDADAAALEAALELELAEPADAEVTEQPRPAEAVEVSSGDDSSDDFDDAFALLDEMTNEPSDVPGLQLDEDAFDELDEPKKKSKLPMVIGVVAVAAIGGYLATSGGGGAQADPLSGDSPEAKALKASYERALEALASGDVERMKGAMTALEPAMCLEGCEGSQCVKDEQGGCEISKDAAPFAPFFLLYDRLWLEANQTNANVQDHAAAVLKALQAQAEAPFGKERLSAVADYWNASQPQVDETSNKSALSLAKVVGAIPQAADTPALVALKQLDGGSADKAAAQLKEATADPAKTPDARLMTLAQARQTRVEAPAKGCGPVNEAYLAAVKAGLPSMGRELALFLGTNGDLKGAALAAGKAADTDPMLRALVTASKLGPEASDQELMVKYKAQNKVTMRKSKKIIKFLYGQLGKYQEMSEKRGDLLAGIQEMFPNAVKEGLEGAWTSVALGQAAEGEAKAKHGEKALKRFERILAADPNRRDALLGRAAAALLVGKADAHRADAFAWLFAQKGVEKPACVVAVKAPEAPAAK